MPSISNKGSNMPQSPIRMLVKYADAAKKKGVHVYHLNIGQPDIKTPPAVLEAVRNLDMDVLAYSSSQGSEEYRSKIAEYYQKHSIEVAAEDIIVTVGGSEALLFAIGCVADNGDEIIISEPYYANYNGFASASDIKIVPVSSKIENNFALPPVEEFEKRITDKTKAILICNPGNPTGYVYTKEEIQQLAALVKKHDLFLIADEVYREFIYDENVAHQSVLAEFGLEDHAIIIDSVSKRYSMCGARIGYLVSKNKEVIQNALKFAQARLCPPTIELMAGEAALETDQSYFDEVVHEYSNRRNTLIAELSKIEGVKVSMPKGAFYCIAELPVEDTNAFAQWLLTDFAVDNATVMVAPAAGFYKTEGMGRNQIRIAYVLNEADLIKSTCILGEALKAYKG